MLWVFYSALAFNLINGNRACTFILQIRAQFSKFNHIHFQSLNSSLIFIINFLCNYINKWNISFKQFLPLFIKDNLLIINQRYSVAWQQVYIYVFENKFFFCIFLILLYVSYKFHNVWINFYIPFFYTFSF